MGPCCTGFQITQRTKFNLGRCRCKYYVIGKANGPAGGGITCSRVIPGCKAASPSHIGIGQVFLALANDVCHEESLPFFVGHLNKEQAHWNNIEYPQIKPRGLTKQSDNRLCVR